MDLSKDTAYFYTDGSCWPNPGPGGWGVVCLYQGKAELSFGGSPEETNNSMELEAVTMALNKAIEMQPPKVIIHSDSQYCINVATKWWKGWQKKGWVTSSGKQVSNLEKIQALVASLEQLKKTCNVSFEWIKGHSGNPRNEAADKLARLGRAEVEGESSDKLPTLEEIEALSIGSENLTAEPVVKALSMKDVMAFMAYNAGNTIEEAYRKVNLFLKEKETFNEEAD